MRKILSSVTRYFLRQWQVEGHSPTKRELALAFLLERLHPPSRLPAASLAQALYTRPTPQCEREISLLLRRPIASVRSHLAWNRLHNSRLELRRTRRGRAMQVRRYCDAIRFEQQQDYLDLLRADTRSRIVGSFHFGDFLFGAARLFSLESARRRSFVVSLNRSVQASYENLHHGFGQRAPGSECELLLRELGPAQLSQLLREGSTSLLLFCDLPPGLSETTCVRFLDRPARFSIGPALLALANRVPLLPLLSVYDGGSNCVRLGQQIEPELLETETLRQGARRLTQELVSVFERFLLGHPEQWRFLPLLPSYYCATGKR